MILSYTKGTLTSRQIKIKFGIFQGDSQSPLLFCLSLATLNEMLNDTKCGYEVQGKKISHLLYMDDLKTGTRNDNEQKKLLDTLKISSDDIKNADVDWLYVPRNKGGRGLTQLETVYKTSPIGLNVYLGNTNDHLLKFVYQHETKRKLYSVNKETRKFRAELGIPDHTRKQNKPVTNYAKRIQSTAK